jgi:hypothetical protein
MRSCEIVIITAEVDVIQTALGWSESKNERRITAKGRPAATFPNLNFPQLSPDA